MFLNTLKTLITEGKAGIRQLYKGYTEQAGSAAPTGAVPCSRFFFPVAATAAT